MCLFVPTASCPGSILYVPSPEVFIDTDEIPLSLLLPTLTGPSPLRLPPQERCFHPLTTLVALPRSLPSLFIAAPSCPPLCGALG